MKILQISAVPALIVLMLVTQATAQTSPWQFCGANKPIDLTNRPALLSATAIVLGDPARVDCDTLKGNWPHIIENAPFNMKAEWDGGLKFSDAVKFLKMVLAVPSNGPLRIATVDDAFLEVYGRPSTATEMLEWEPQVKAQTAWYATIASAEIKKLNSNIGTRRNTTGRRPMVNQAYKTSMGRIANDGESSYWLPRTEHHRLIVNASRAWLYSANGEKDLISTVKLALATKNGAAPSEADVKAAIIKFKGNAAKPIYAEMIK